MGQGRVAQDHASPMSSSSVDRLAYSPTEVAEAFGCTRQHIHNMLARGELKSIKLGRKRLIPAEVVEQLLSGAE